MSACRQARMLQYMKMFKQAKVWLGRARLSVSAAHKASFCALAVICMCVACDHM